MSACLLNLFCSACSRTCQNGGSLNGTTCTCNCADGYSGPNCESKCIIRMFTGSYAQLCTYEDEDDKIDDNVSDNDVDNGDDDSHNDYNADRLVQG